MASLQTQAWVRTWSEHVQSARTRPWTVAGRLGDQISRAEMKAEEEMYDSVRTMLDQEIG